MGAVRAPAIEIERKSKEIVCILCANASDYMITQSVNVKHHMYRGGDLQS